MCTFDIVVSETLTVIYCWNFNDLVLIVWKKTGTVENSQKLWEEYTYFVHIVVQDFVSKKMYEILYESIRS